MSSVGTLDSMMTAASSMDEERKEAVEAKTEPPTSEEIEHDGVSLSPSEVEHRDIAHKLFQEDFVSIQPEEYMQYLAANDKESSRIRSYYMDCFEWDANLLQSTRMLCSKLYLKGESQEIDRILSAFTKSYLKQHPNNLFQTRNFEKIYIIIYSLILLNTALHNAEVNKKNVISQSDYIRNTFTTFVQTSKLTKLTVKQKIAIECELSNYYEHLRDNELHLKNSDISSDRRQSKYVKEDDSNEVTVGGGAENSLSRQVSNTSLWSTDSANNTRRSSLAMKRMSSSTSAVSHFTMGSTADRSKRGAGFARALLSEQNAQFYKNNNVSTSSASTIRQQQGSLYEPYRQHTLNKRTSRSSVVSKDHQQNVDDAVSVLSLDTMPLAYPDEGEIHLDDFDVNDYQDHFDLELELQGSPYLKEGLLKLKVLNNDQQEEQSQQQQQQQQQNQSSGSRFLSFFSKSSNSVAGARAAPRESAALSSSRFVENFVVVSKGELSIYSFDPKVIKKHQQATQRKHNKHSKHKKHLSVIAEDGETGENGGEAAEEEEVGDGNWLKNAANVGNYKLCSTYASLEKPHMNPGSNKKTILWSLTFPKVSRKPPKKFLFEAGTKEIALEFVNTCNFWAAKITAIPALEESVSSIEYGWTNFEGLVKKRDQFKKMKHIMKWEPVPKGVYLSNYVAAPSQDNRANHEGMMKQFVKTLNYYNHLKKLYNDFTALKSRFSKSLPPAQYSCANYARIMANYDAKIQEYKLDLTKYKNYLIILGFGLQLRFDLEDADLLPEDDELSTVVRAEIVKLFSSMKDISSIIPTFQTSKSINNMASLVEKKKEPPIPHEHALVKSPKTFTLSNFSETESPINQLLQTTNEYVVSPKSYATETINEEEEPEEEAPNA